MTDVSEQPKVSEGGLTVEGNLTFLGLPATT